MNKTPMWIEMKNGKDPIKISPLCKMKYIIDANGIHDIGSMLSEETEKNLKSIDDNIRYATINAHRIWCD